jgi:preprotein translocase subunit SecD
MSDLKKDLNEVTPPKPKKVIRQKAKKSVTQILARTRKKVAKAEQSLRSAKRHAENTKSKLLTINKALTGKETQLLTEDIIESAPKTVQEHINQQDVIFKPNGGPQTQFLAASEREVFLWWSERWW